MGGLSALWEIPAHPGGGGAGRRGSGDEGGHGGAGGAEPEGRRQEVPPRPPRDPSRLAVTSLPVPPPGTPQGLVPGVVAAVVAAVAGAVSSFVAYQRRRLCFREGGEVTGGHGVTGAGSARRGWGFLWTRVTSLRGGGGGRGVGVFAMTSHVLGAEPGLERRAGLPGDIDDVMGCLGAELTGNGDFVTGLGRGFPRAGLVSIGAVTSPGGVGGTSCAASPHFLLPGLRPRRLRPRVDDAMAPPLRASSPPPGPR